MHEAERAVLDVHDAERLGMPERPTRPDVHYIATPESTTIRRLLAEALRQLPADGINLVLFGHRQGDRHDLERALEGPEVVDFILDKRTKSLLGAETRRVGTAAFVGESAEQFGVSAQFCGSASQRLTVRFAAPTSCTRTQILRYRSRPR